MNRFYLPVLIFVLFIGLCNLAFGQGKENERKRGETGKIEVKRGEKFDFVFNRTAIIPINTPDSVAFDASRSSSSFLGISFNLPIGKTKAVALKVEPGVTWQRITYDGNNENKYFPLLFRSPQDTTRKYLWERHKGIFAETALGIRFNLYRNVDDKVKLFAEIGGSGGYMFASSYKRRSISPTNGKFVTEKFHKERSLRPYRYGAYFRFGTNWGSIYTYYRFSDVYEDGPYRHPDLDFREVDHPNIGRLEIGFSLLF